MTADDLKIPEGLQVDQWGQLWNVEISPSRELIFITRPFGDTIGPHVQQKFDEMVEAWKQRWDRDINWSPDSLHKRTIDLNKYQGPDNLGFSQ